MPLHCGFEHGSVWLGLRLLFLFGQFLLIGLPAGAPARVPFPYLADYGLGVLLGTLVHAAGFTTRFHISTSFPQIES